MNKFQITSSEKQFILERREVVGKAPMKSKTVNQLLKFKLAYSRVMDKFPDTRTNAPEYDLKYVLDDLVGEGLIKKPLRNKIMKQFDKMYKTMMNLDDDMTDFLDLFYDIKDFKSTY